LPVWYVGDSNVICGRVPIRDRNLELEPRGVPGVPGVAGGMSGAG
jgi:hypothetical protein